MTLADTMHLGTWAVSGIHLLVFAFRLYLGRESGAERALILAVLFAILGRVAT